jgi:hypothetical protein
VAQEVLVAGLLELNRLCLVTIQSTLAAVALRLALVEHQEMDLLAAEPVVAVEEPQQQQLQQLVALDLLRP